MDDRQSSFTAGIHHDQAGRPQPVNVDGADRASLSELQHAYLLGELGEFELGGPALFYEEYSCRELDLPSFSAALCTLMRRHEMLRATFLETGQLLVRSDLPVPLTYRSLRRDAAAAVEEVLAGSREELCEQGPPLADSAPFEVRVFALPDQFVVQVCGRLLAMDGFSGEIFAQELRSLLAGVQLPPLHYTYRQYRHEMEQRGTRTEYAEARQYWMGRLDSLPAAPELPLSRCGTRVSSRLVRRSFQLAPEVWTALDRQIKKSRLTGTMGIGAAFCEVLRHWSKKQGFTINIMYGDRAPVDPDIAGVIGNFSSTVLLASVPAATDRTFLDRARTLRRQLLNDLQHSTFGGVSVIRELNRRSGNVAAAVMPVVFTSMLGVGDTDTGVFLEHLGWTRLHGRVRTPQVALDHQVFVADNALVVTWDSADELYPAGMIDDMFAAYERLLHHLATDELAWQSEAFDLTPPPHLAVRGRVNSTAAPVPPETLHGLFVRQAVEHPERVALLTATEQVTYQDLLDRALRVSGSLTAAGTKPGDLVGVTEHRGVDQVTALLGVLFAGAAYVPVAPDWPDLRRDQILRKAGIRTLLVGDTIHPAGLSPSVTVLPMATARLGHRPDGIADEDDALAYVIFTSGTTGTPKGVMIRHQAAVNTLVDINDRFDVGPRDRVLAVSDYTFDLSVYDVFGVLGAGGAVVLPDAGQSREVTHLYDLATTHGVTVWNSVPAYLGMFADFVQSGGRRPLETLRLAMVSGDWVPVRMAQDLAAVAPGARCVSLGGATEAAVWSNQFPVPVDVPAEWSSIPYGFPLRNQRYHVLDDALGHRPDWVPGELYIAGRGLADGYLGEAELTAAAFRRHPCTGERLYRTGDWGRYWPDGTLEFLGREDPQVKINGFRVELGEVEAALLSHPRVTDAVVVPRTAGPQYGGSLVAFVAVESERSSFRPDDGAPDLPWTENEEARRLRAALYADVRRRLPGYMIPAVIELAKALPLTANGKVNRAALALRAASLGAAQSGPVDPPLPGTEQALAALWQELLGLAQVGRHDEFFAIGGSSLDAAQLMNRIEQRFGPRLPLATLYTSGTLAALADRIASSAGAPVDRYLARLAPGAGSPLVLVHPVGGDLLCYRDLVARLGGGHLVLGLHSPDSGPQPTSVAAMARAYLGEVLAVAGSGPYRLVGWSLGGTVAYEMGRQLLAAGHECSVVMIDPWVGRGAAPGPADLVHAFGVNLAGGRPVPAADTLAALYAGLAPEMAYPDFQRLYDVFERNTRALVEHELRAVPGLSADVLVAADGLAGAAGEYLRPVAEVLPASAEIRFQVVPGNHFDVVAAGSVVAVVAG